MTTEQQNIEKIINNLENKTTKTDDENTELQTEKRKLQTIYNDRVRGNMIRCRILDYEHGDRPSNYFLNLEKVNKQKRQSISLKIAQIKY